MFYIYYIFYKVIKKEQRQILNNKLNESIFNILKKRLDFQSFPLSLANKLIKNIDLEPGTAKNKALLEIIFTLFSCVNTKVPVFICGKPGCSKTLSTRIILQNMIGKDSKNEIFQNLPKVRPFYIQGSLNSTSNGILKVFEKARNYERNKEIKDKISLIYFDEMNLAEESKNNPLKVIHSQLEYYDNKDKVSFIGISNYILDASKMNRGIHLSILELDKEDLQLTAHEIVKSVEETLLKDNVDIFNNLSFAFCEYKSYLKENKNDLYDFHGNRDFYYMIKIAAYKMIKNNNKIDSALKSIERNFGGFELENKLDSITLFKEKFLNQKIFNHIYDIQNIINDSLNDKMSRYILIITKITISQFLIDSILSNIRKNYKFFIGSRFENDINKGEYSAKILNKIQICMEQGNITVFKNLESIYPSLYIFSISILQQ